MALPAPDSGCVRPPVGGRWTASDLDCFPEDGLRYEVLDGQLVVTPAPALRHQIVLQWLMFALIHAVPEGSWVLPGVGILIGDDEPIPDLIVGVGERAPDARGIAVEQIILAVEVVSPCTTLQDTLVKPVVYAQAGIPNYWRIEAHSFKGRLPDEAVPVLFAHVLGRNGEYEATHRISAGECATLHSPFEFTIDPATLLR
ncbi:Uma2 family endonuclease [Nocardia wallacei]|uniref:Uma2 family endonuclease n=1 Tax=Nocardia wallacei TaxID=480035 RepID=UPI0024550473|nr:Uma2 family endonuclease [Nocardia wallacei]